MAEKNKLSLKEKLAQERQKRAKSDTVSLAPKKSLVRAKKDLKTVKAQVEQIHPPEIAVPKPQKKLAKKMPPPKKEKERFTLWLSESTYKAFKVHTATRKGSGSDYIEALIKRDLKLN